jgi:hypothetical protein
MCRAKPQVETIVVNGRTMTLKLKKTRPIMGSGTKYKNVFKKKDEKYHAYITVDGGKVYVGCYKTEFDAAVAVAAAHQASIKPASPKKKREPAPPLEQELSPLLTGSINDKEASRLSSPVSVPPTPEVMDDNSRWVRLDPSSANRIHKTLLQTWYEGNGTPFKPTANAASMRIPLYPNGI